tara:strand:- start:2129 stop:2560 length:432 start_codon:yes stop_codon:yes gene_type:complete
MHLKNLIIVLFSLFIINSCTEKTTFGGKIINNENLNKINATNKKELIEIFGKPSYQDHIQNKIFYFTEKKKSKNFYNNKIEYSYLFVFTLDNNNMIIDKSAFDLKDKKFKEINKNVTRNDIIKRGLIEKIFGGVGAGPIPTTP